MDIGIVVSIVTRSDLSQVGGLILRREVLHLKVTEIGNSVW